MRPSTRSVDILLATYNGGRFLAEQLQSLERQTFRSWRLIARDDGSTDATRALLADFQARHPAAVRLIEDSGARLGAAGNYARLLQAMTADFGLFCDQDDVWQPDKIESLLTMALAHERPGVPLLVHSDLAVVDQDLRLVAPSFWRYQFIRPERCQWSRLAVQNVVTGCACLFNDALRRAALPIPPEAIMHDWWLALVAATVGDIRWTDAVTVQYRQHDGNDTGAKAWGPVYLRRHAAAFFRRRDFQEKVRLYQRQAGALAAHGGLSLAASTRAGLHEFAHLHTRSYPGRVGVLLRHRILKTGLWRNAALLARV